MSQSPFTIAAPVPVRYCCPGCLCCCSLSRSLSPFAAAVPVIICCCSRCCSSLSLSLLPFAISVPVVISRHGPCLCSLSRSLSPFPVTVFFVIRYCSRCRGSLLLPLSPFTAAVPVVISRHSLYNRHSLSLSNHRLLLLFLPMFTLAVVAAVGYRCPCRHLLSLSRLTFPAMVATAVRCHGHYRHLLLLSLSSFAITVATTVCNRCSCRHLLSLSWSPLPATVPAAVCCHSLYCCFSPCCRSLLRSLRFPIAVPITIRCRRPSCRSLCRHSPPRSLSPFAVAVPVVVRYRSRFYGLQSLFLSPFAVAIMVTTSCCGPCCCPLSQSLSLFAVRYRCPSHHWLSLLRSPFPAMVPAAVRFHSLYRCSLLLSLLFAVAVTSKVHCCCPCRHSLSLSLLSFPVTASTAVRGHSLYRHLLSLSLSLFTGTVADPSVISCCGPYHCSQLQ